MDPLIKSSNQSEPLENNIVNTDYFSYKLRFTGNGSEYFGESIFIFPHNFFNNLEINDDTILSRKTENGYLFILQS